jgi:hypothetical protein
VEYIITTAKHVLLCEMSQSTVNMVKINKNKMHMESQGSAQSFCRKHCGQRHKANDTWENRLKNYNLHLPHTHTHSFSSCTNKLHNSSWFIIFPFLGIASPLHTV